MSDNNALITEVDSARSGWLVWSGRHPVLITFGTVLVLLLIWIGTGLIIEQRFIAAREYLKSSPKVSLGNAEMRSHTLLTWLPESTVSFDFKLVDYEFLSVKAPLTSADVALICKLRLINTFYFEPDGDVSDEDLRRIVLSQPLRELVLPKNRTLSAETLRTIAARKTLIDMYGVNGPFDQPMLDALEETKNLQRLNLVGPAISNTKPSFPDVEHLRWNDSQLSDAQFKSVLAKQRFSSLNLDKTQLTAKSWPLLKRLTCDYLAIESSAIDPSIAAQIPGSATGMSLRGGRLSDEAIKTLTDRPIPFNRLAITARGLTCQSAQHLAAWNGYSLTLFDGQSGMAQSEVAEPRPLGSGVLDILQWIPLPDGRGSATSL